MKNSDEALDVAERFIAALTAADIDAVREIYSPDVRIWHNFTGELQSVDDNIKSLLWMHRTLNGMNYDVQRREPIPGGFYQQHILRGTLASGEEFAMPACAICKVEDGHIVMLEEYLDSAQTAPLMS